MQFDYGEGKEVTLYIDRQKMMRELIRMRVLELINNKPKMAELVYAALTVEFIAATKEEIHLVVENMVLKKQLIELEYRMDDVVGSILFPFECDIYLKFSNGVHRFVRKKKEENDHSESS